MGGLEQRCHISKLLKIQGCLSAANVRVGVRVGTHCHMRGKRGKRKASDHWEEHNTNCATPVVAPSFDHGQMVVASSRELSCCRPRVAGEQARFRRPSGDNNSAPSKATTI